MDAADHKPIKVFVADDVPDMRALVRFALEDSPDMVVVGEAGTGAEAVEGVGKTRPDVVLLDLSMPDLDGLEVIAVVLERSPDRDRRLLRLRGGAHAGPHARARRPPLRRE